MVIPLELRQTSIPAVYPCQVQAYISAGGFSCGFGLVGVLGVVGLVWPGLIWP